jgi:peptidoglycan/xylan/chitin deacetylase (PgdA/CDA1 family)
VLFCDGRMLLESLVVAAFAAGFMGWAVRGRSSNVFGRSLWRGPRDRQVVALTFDDGPSESTLLLLDALGSLGVRATFFVSGASVERLPEVARSIAASGHEIGSHGYSHAPLYLRSPAFVRDELERAQRAITAATGVAPRLYRPSFGCRWFGLRGAQRRLGLTTVMWTVIGRDWKWPAGRIAERLVRGASNGAIFCLHDGRVLAPGPDIRPTIEALHIAVPRLRARGFRFETAGALLRASLAENS